MNNAQILHLCIVLYYNKNLHMTKRILDILHLADIQIRVTNSGADKDRHDEYRYSLIQMSNIIAERKPDILVIPGDIFEVWDANGDEVKLFADFIHACLPNVKRIVIVPGNHDLKSRNNLILSNSTRRNQTDIIQSTVISINDKKISYYDVTGFHNDTVFPITWCVWSHKYKLSSTGDNPLPYSPFENGAEIPEDAYPNQIELFHDPVANCIGFDGQPDPTFKDYGITLANFQTNTIIAGDIHSPSIVWFGEDKKRLFTYSSSLVQRNFGEGNVYFDAECGVRGNEKHGYNLIQFDTEENRAVSCEFVQLPNPVSRHTIRISKDFNWDRLTTLNFNATKYNKVKVIIQGNVAAFIDNESKLIEHLQNIAPCSIDFEYAADAFDMLVDDSLITSVESIADKATILKIASKYIEDVVSKTSTIQPEDKEEAIEFILSNLRKEIDKIELLNAQSSIKLISAKISNFMSFREDVDINFKDKKITKISGTNGVGKTTIFSFILWMIADLISEYQTARNKNTNYSLYFNDSSDNDEVFGSLVFDKNGDLHILEKTLTRSRKKNGEVSGYSIQLSLKSAALCSDDNAQILEYLQNDIFTFDEMNRSMFVNQRSLTDLIKTSSSDLNSRILKNIGIDFFNDMLDKYDDLRSNLLDKLEKPNLSVDELLAAKALNENTISDTKALINRLKDSRDEKEDQMLFVEADINNLKAILNNVGDVKTVNDKIACKDAEILSNDNAIQELSANHANAVEAVTNSSELSISNELNQQKSVIQSKEHSVQILESNLVSAKASVEDKETSAKQTVAIVKGELETEVNSITAKISEVEKEVSTVKLEQAEAIRLHNAKIETEASELRAKESAVREEISKIYAQRDAKTADINTIKVAMSSQKSAIEALDEKIAKLNDTTTCPTCSQPLSKEKREEIELSINKLKEDRASKQSFYDEQSKTLTVLEDDFEKLADKLDDENTLASQYKLDAKELDESKITKFENCKYDEKLVELQKTIDELSKSLESAKTKLAENIKLDQRYIDAVNLFVQAKAKVATIEEEIVQAKEDVKTESAKLEPIQAKLKGIEELKVKLGEIVVQLQDAKDKKIKLDADLEVLRKDLDKAENDEITKKHLEPLDAQLAQLKTDISSTKESIAKEEVNLDNYEKAVIDFDKKIENARKYKLIESSMKLYKKMLGQSGLPQYIFAHIIPIINKHLNELLEDVDFRLQFDQEDLVLKFHDVKRRTIRPVIFISGMEETVSALALVDVMRKLNNAKKTREIFIDEISGKLNNGKELTYEARNYQLLVSKLLSKIALHSNVYIIDHVLNLHEARVIEVCPSEKGSYIKELN